MHCCLDLTGCESIFTDPENISMKIFQRYFWNAFLKFLFCLKGFTFSDKKYKQTGKTKI